MDEARVFLISLLPWLAKIALALIASVALSFVARPMLRSLRHLRKIAWKAASLASTFARKSWDDFVAYWHRHSADFSHPAIVELSRLRKAVAALGKPIFDDLRRDVEQLHGAVRRLPRVDADEEILKLRHSGPGTSWFIFSLGFVALIGLSAANFWLLRLFFSQRVGQALGWVGVGRYLTGADMLAFLFPLVEFSAGVVLHVLQVREDENAPTARRVLGALAPWSILVALGIVEAFAYAQLSVSFGLDQALDLTPADPLYPLARYFMAPFGAALTLGIAGLGYYLIGAWLLSHDPRALAKNASRLSAARSALEALHRTAMSTVDQSSKAIEEAEQLINRKLTAVDGPTGSRNLADQIGAYARHLLEPTNHSARTADVGHLSMYLLQTAAWAIAAWLNARHFSYLASAFDSPTLQTLVGVAVSATVAFVGFAVGQRDYERRDSQQSILEGHTIPVWLLFPLGVLLIGLSVSLAVEFEPISQDWWWSNGLYGAVLPIALMCLSVNLPTLAHASVVGSRLAFTLLAIGTVMVGAAAAGLVGWLAVATAWMARFLSIPGFAVRRRPVV